MAPAGNGPPTGGHALTVLVGNPKPRSRTRRVVLRAADLLREQLIEAGASIAAPRVVDLADLSVGSIMVPAEERCPAVAEALGAVMDGGLLVVGSPTFKGTFTGLLKLFLDLLPRQGLTGAVALPVMTAASAAHTHAVESYLRPLLIASGATVPVSGLSVLEAQFDDIDSVLSRWSAAAAPVLHGLLARTAVDPMLTRAQGLAHS